MSDKVVCGEIAAAGDFLPFIFDRPCFLSDEQIPLFIY